MKTIKTAAMITLTLLLTVSIGYIARPLAVSVPKPAPDEIIITPTNHPAIDVKSLVHDHHITPINHTTIDVKSLLQGNHISLPLGEERVVGVINFSQRINNGTWQHGGNLLHHDGTFALAVDTHGEVSGYIISHSRRIAYALKNGVFERVPIDSVVCSHLPVLGDTNVDLEAGAAVETGTTTTIPASIKIPQLASRPSAKVHMYLDFDGERVTDPLWNGGRLIDAKAPSYTEAQIREIWSIVAERYAAFNINVTTRPDDYTSADVNSRARAIFTPSNEWRRGFGGIAMINSMRNAGKSVWSPTIPCWVFTNMLSRLRSVGECAAHELGHTLGLSHDGTSKSAYYTGQGSWAPIMGTTYDRPVAQWSKGEYTGANNTQDDIAIILSNKNMMYAVAQRTAPTLTFVDAIRATGVICNEKDVATYRTSISKSGKLTMTGTVPTYGALNIMMELVDASGKVIATSNTLNSLNTTTTVDITPGVYTVRVQGAGEGDVKTTGYTKYGSIGTFTLITELK
jgi:hypothetical protein